MNKFKPTIIAALLIAATSLVIGVSANTGDENPGKAFSRENRAQMHEQMQEAIISGDYEAWAELVASTPWGEKLLKIITEDNFDRFREAHDLKMEAKELMQESRAIMEELGLGGPGFHKKSMSKWKWKRGMRGGHRFNKS